MAKVTVNGIKDNPGTWGMPLLDPGWYVVQLNVPKIEEKESEKGTGTNYSFMSKVIDTVGSTEEQSTGMEPLDQTIFLNIYLMNEDHQSYDKWHQIGEGQLKKLLDVCDIPLKGNSFDPEDFADKTLKVKVKHTKEGRLEVVEIDRDPENG